MKQRLRPQRSVSLLQGIIRIAMISRNSVIAVWTPFDGRVQVVADVVDHHVHVRAGEAADELRERERQDQPTRGRKRPLRRQRLAHSGGAVAHAAACEPALAIAAAATISVRWLNACGKLPTCRRALHVVLLGEQAEVVAQAEQPLEQRARLVDAAVAAPAR